MLRNPSSDWRFVDMPGVVPWLMSRPSMSSFSSPASAIARSIASPARPGAVLVNSRVIAVMPRPTMAPPPLGLKLAL
jgi:hypothetical protein